MKKSGPGRVILKIFKWLLITAGILLLCGVIYIVVQISRAPDIDDISIVPDGYLTTIQDQDGNVTRTLAGEEANRIYCTLDEIPEDVQDAFIAVEDARFYSHHGIDPQGILRAAVRGITSGDFSEGASTITQQLIKNSVLDSTWEQESSFLDKINRKIQEQYLAIQLEKKYSKEYILEVYLNTINLGSGTWGVQAAANRYFGKNVSDLTLSEAAVIAGITKNPSAYDPIDQPEQSRERFEIVLSAMKTNGYITEEEYQQALSDNVFERIASDHKDANTTPFSYFEDALLESIVSDLQEQQNMSEDDAWDLIYRGGLTICSTEDTGLQQIVENSVNQEGICDDQQQVSAVVMDPDTGAVRAIVGGRGAKESSLIYNRATESQRQPGSTIKIIGEYAAAFENKNITLATVYDDCPSTYSDGTELHNSDGLYHGMTTIRDAIACSYNVVALKVFQEQGQETVDQMLQDFGITSLDYSAQTEAMAIGGTNGGVTNLELTAAYNALANDGIYEKPFYYTQVLDHDGHVLLQNDSSDNRVVSEETAQMLTTAMQEVMQSGTGVAANFDGMPVAGKSGTTDDNRDFWFVGYTPYYTCCVWGGYDSNSPQEDSTYVKEIWRNIMSTAHADKEYDSFPLSSDTQTVKICTKCGKLAVSGLCEDTVEGDMTRMEVFTADTVPKTKCTCHVKVKICTTSGMKAGAYCPLWTRTEKVYLKTATAGTLDEAYAADNVSDTCTEHKNLLDTFTQNGNSEDGQSSGSEGSGQTDQQTDSSGQTTDPYGAADAGDQEADSDSNENGDSGETEDQGNGNSWSDWWNNLWH